MADTLPNSSCDIRKESDLDKLKSKALSSLSQLRDSRIRLVKLSDGMSTGESPERCTIDKDRPCPSNRVQEITGIFDDIDSERIIIDSYLEELERIIQ